MVKRNMQKIVESTVVPNAYCMSLEEVMKLYIIEDREELFNALGIAFTYGFALGGRYIENQRKKGA